ncbi:MAG: hypothetical protein NTZ45_01460 [Methylococcales bacterium]|nr:hypothetical protein [Methylococcales bacterium]
MDTRTVIDGMSVFFRVYETNIEDDDFSGLIEDLEEKICDQLHQGQQLMAVGQTLYVGYDCEWVERSGGNIQVLSYQFYLIGIGGEIAVVFLADERLALKDMLNVIMKIAFQTGTALHYPRDIVFTGYFLRADLAMLSDLVEFKHNLSNIGGSVGTTNQPVYLDLDAYKKSDDNRAQQFYQGNQSYLSRITFYDLAKHALEKTPLSVLGDLLGIEKLEVPNIAEMDKLRKQDFTLFINYGIRDAEIVVKYYQHILEFAKNVLDIKSDLIPSTAGSLAVSLCKLTINDFDDVFGLTRVERKHFDAERNRFSTKRGVDHSNDREFYETFVSKCYHGGMNICYYAGATEVDHFLDYDLSGAYTTGMNVIRPPDYEKSFESRKITDFLGDVMGFALVHFNFPSKTKYPCLPVKSLSRDGLYFPLEGESFCTAPELALAVRMGAKLTIKRGVIYPWKSEERIFKPFV